MPNESVKEILEDNVPSLTVIKVRSFLAGLFIAGAIWCAKEIIVTLREPVSARDQHE